MRKVTIDSVYAQAREVLKEGRVDEARDLADYGIVMAAEAQEEGLGMDDELEGVRIGLWLERFWYFLENIKMALHNLKHYNAGGLDPDVADELNQIDFATEEIERELNAL